VSGQAVGVLHPISRSRQDSYRVSRNADGAFSSLVTLGSRFTLGRKESTSVEVRPQGHWLHAFLGVKAALMASGQGGQQMKSSSGKDYRGLVGLELGRATALYGHWLLFFSVS
jgi:hypothetical protein